MALPYWWGFLLFCSPALSQKGVTSSILHDAACGSEHGHKRVAAQDIPDFSLWSIKVAELSKRNSNSLDSKCEFPPHRLWASHLLGFFISWYQVLICLLHVAMIIRYIHYFVCYCWLFCNLNSLNHGWEDDKSIINNRKKKDLLV